MLMPQLVGEVEVHYELVVFHLDPVQFRDCVLMLN